DFFTDIFDGNKALAVQFLHGVVYTNGNFIRTPNENSQHGEKLEIGRNLTKKYLQEIIEIVKPSTIICFGNSEHSATSAIINSLQENEDIPFWKLESGKIVQTTNNWNTYHFKIESKEKQYNIYS